MDNENEIVGSSNQDVGRHIVNAWIQWARMKGYSDSIGFLRGLAVLAKKPVSLDELVQETGYSKSTVSSNMNLLESMGLVKRIVIPGDKRHIYAPIIGPEIIMTNMLDTIEGFEKLINRNVYILLIQYYLVYEDPHRFCHSRRIFSG